MSIKWTKVTNVYHKHGNNIFTIICLYEDDLLIFGLKIHVMNYVKSLFINNIDKKDLEVEVILGFKITRSEKRTFLMNLTKLKIS